jgi:phosphoribosylformimino-5-aminoimidazole carboxamide ribotide isomerase
MQLLPAIDLMDGCAVRLRRGLAAEKTVYSNDPAAFARRWEAEGGDWLHLVDLDAAFSGNLQNLESVRAITRAVSIPCELGGGMRSEAAVQAALDAGVARVVIGTRASDARDFVAGLVDRFGGDRIAVGIDANGGKVAVKGWTETTELDAETLARDVEAAGVGTIIYTDIATDGMLAGPNVAAMESLVRAVGCGVIASGGVSRDADLLRLAQIPGLRGAIIGKALYENRVDLAAVARELRARP